MNLKNRLSKKDFEISKAILEGLARGKTRKEVARELQMPVNEIMNRIRQLRARGVNIPKGSRAKIKKDEIDDRILELRGEGRTIKEIAKELFFSESCISNRIRKMRERGIDIPKGSRKKRELDETDQKILDGLAEGKTQTEIASQLSLSRSSVYKRIKDMKKRGMEIPKEKDKKAEDEELNNRILEGLRAGKSRRKIGNELGKAKSTISMRIKRMSERGIEIPQVSRIKTENDETDDRILELRREGKTILEISRELYMAESTIQDRISGMRERGIDIPKLSRKRTTNDETDDRILELRREGRTIKEIAKELHFSEFTISARIKKMRERGIDVPKATRKKRRHDEIDKKIIAMLEEGKAQNEIARELGISEASVSKRIKKIREMETDSVQVLGLKRTNKEINQEILEGLAEGKSKTEIARMLGMPKSNIYSRISRMKRKGISAPNVSEARDKRILECLSSGMTIQEISVELDLAISAIYRRINKMKARGIEINRELRQKDESEKIDNIILEGLAKGKSRKEIADELGMAKSTICARIVRMKARGVEIPYDLSQKDQKTKIESTIIRGLEEGKMIKDIAQELGKARSTISERIRRMRARGIVIPGETKPLITQPEEQPQQLFQQPQQQPQIQYQHQQSQYSEEGIKRAILKLSKTRNASNKQLKILAEQYGVDISTELDFMDVEQDEGPEL